MVLGNPLFYLLKGDDMKLWGECSARPSTLRRGLLEDRSIEGGLMSELTFRRNVLRRKTSIG